MPSDSTASQAPRANNPYTHAMALARSADARALGELATLLTTVAFLDSLDSADAYLAPMEQLRIAAVVQRLGENRSPAALTVLERLTRDEVYLAQRSRVAALIDATTEVRPPSDAIVAFWNAHCEPEDGYGAYTMRAVFTNGTPAALSVFTRQMADAKHEEDRLTWLRFHVVAHRNERPVLEAATRLIGTLRDAALRRELVAVLFDYRPDEWYGPHLIATPRPRTEAAPDALRQLLAAGDQALAMPDLGEPLHAQVTREMSTVRELLRGR